MRSLTGNYDMLLLNYDTNEMLMQNYKNTIDNSAELDAQSTRRRLNQAPRLRIKRFSSSAEIGPKFYL